jgi:zinc transporter
VTRTTFPGLLCGFRFDSSGQRVALDAPPLQPPGEGETVWLSFDREEPAAERWIRDESGIDPAFHAALVEEDPRSRIVRTDGALLLVLRTANMRADSEVDELVSLRIWADNRRVITVHGRSIAAIAQLEAGGVPPEAVRSSGSLVVHIAERLVDGLEDMLDELNDQMDRLEESLIQQPSSDLAAELGTHRRKMVQFHRYLAPQREVLHRLATDPPTWIAEHENALLRETANSGSRHLDELQAARDHATIVQEELSARLADRLNRRLYLFTVIASIFLPLTFFTGLLGSNVEGIPYADKAWAFPVVALLCVVIASIQFLVLRLIRLL